MPSKLIITALIVLITSQAFSQKFISEQSMVFFFSHAAVEDITAKNTNTTSIFNSSTGEIVFSIPVTDFIFEKSLMQEHFNEKYLETENIRSLHLKGRLLDSMNQLPVNSK